MKAYGTGTKRGECCDMRNGCTQCYSSRRKYSDRKHKTWRHRARQRARKEIEDDDSRDMSQ